MCENYDENKIMDILSKVRLSNYRECFPYFDFDPSEQLQYIEGMVEKLRKEKSAEEKELRSIEEDMEKNKNNESEFFVLESAWNYYGFIYMRHDALRANMQIAMLAPAIEGLYKKSLTILVKEKLGEEKLSGFFNKNTNFKKSVTKGIMKVLGELGFTSYFPSDTESFLSILFDYRNALFHNGLEWSKEECDRFLQKNTQKSWFAEYPNSHSPFFILPTREFIDRLMVFFYDSMDGFVESKGSLSE